MVTHLISPDPNSSENNSGPNRLTPGSTLFDRYLIQEVIGVGGMGSVYRAKDLHFPKVNKFVAIKELVIQSTDPEIIKTVIQNFEREANILAMLEHPAIPKVYDYFSIDDRAFLILELVTGRDLEAILNTSDSFFPEEKVLDWALQLCEVLIFLHNHRPSPIIFRDLKPSNVMINDQDNVVLIDFGIAKPFQLGQKGTMIGTEGYSSPEQYRGEATVQTDVYSLGATLHHALTKNDPRTEPPFSYAERPIRKFNPKISTELERVIQTAVQYEAANRFKTITEFKEALLAAGKKTGILNRLAPQSSRTPVTTLFSPTIKPLWTFRCEDEVRGGPLFFNGGLFFGCYDNNLYSLDASTGDFRWKFPTHGGIVGKPIAVEDYLLFGSEDQSIYAIHNHTGEQIWTYETQGRVRSSGKVADGHLFIGSDDGFLHVINYTTGKMSWVYDTSDQIRSSPFIFGNNVYFGTEGGELISLNFRGKTNWRFKAKRAITSSPWVDEYLTYFCSLDSNLYAVDTTSGWLVWRFRLEKPSIVSPYLSDNTLFTGSSSGTFFAIDTKNGRELWRFKAGGQVNGSPVVYKNKVYFGSIDNHLYCLDIKTGKMNWSFETKGPITGTPTVFDGMIYIGSTDHNMYALIA